MRIGISGPQDFLALIIRRKWWIIGPFLALSSILTILVKELPNLYVSETLILIQPRDIPQNMVMDLVSGSVGDRLASIQKTVLSRTNLLQILTEFKDRLPEYQRLNLDAQVDRLHSEILINFRSDAGPAGKGNALPTTTINSFKISYQNRDPELAQKITSKLTTLFIDQDSRTRETQVFGTTEFLSNELEKVKALLDEAEAKLRAVKATKRYELPETLPANLAALSRFQNAKQAVDEAIDRTITQKLNLEQQIASTPEVVSSKVPPERIVPGRPGAAPGAPPKDPVLEDYRKAKEEFDRASTQNKPGHPDVRVAQARLERAKAKVPPELLEAAPVAATTSEPVDGAKGLEAASPAATEPNPLYLKLLGELRTVETELSARRKEKATNEAETIKYTERVDGTPEAELQMAGLTRENADLKKRYDDLNGKLGMARLSESLESKQKNGQFVIIDPPNYPLEPSKPNKPVDLLVGCLISFVLAIALALAIDIARQRVWTPTEIEAAWSIPVLIDIPALLTDSDFAATRKKKIRFAMFASGVAVLHMAFLFVIYLKHKPILDAMEPVLKKLVYR